MKSKLAIILIIALFGMIRSADIPEEDGVLVLGEDNFDQAIKQHEFLLVEFYAPWCGHCKKLAPEYARAAQTLKKENPPLYIAKVDSTVHKNLSSRFGVEGFPTLKFFVNGNPSEYNGGRTESDIVNWIKKKTGPATKTLNSAQEVKDFTDKPDVSVVYFGDDTTHISAFQNVARSMDDVVFASCATQECYDEFKVKSGSLVLFKKFDEGRNDFTGDYTEENIKEFITKNSNPLVMKFDEKCAQLVFGKSTPGLFFYRDAKASNAKEIETLANTLAQKVKGKIQVVVTDIKEGLETRLAEYIGVTSEDLPTVRIHDTRNELRKFNMEGEINEANVNKFVDDWESGNLKPSLKSQEIPATQDEPVYTLVGKAFNDIVMDPTKDVLVEFYAPWCGHCKKLTPIYDEVATKLKDNKNLIIAKMDSTANEVEAVSIQGFPTIKFWPANNKSSPIDFNEDRTVEGFIKFINKHATNAVASKEDL